MKIETKFIVHDINKSIARRGLEVGQEVQKHIDSEVLRYTSPYVPLDKGDLEKSGTRHTTIGSGKVRYKTPYARKLYHNPQYTFQGAPMRGGKWFERMKADHRDDILRSAAIKAGVRHE